MKSIFCLVLLAHVELSACCLCLHDFVKNNIDDCYFTLRFCEEMDLEDTDYYWYTEGRLEAFEEVHDKIMDVNEHGRGL
jgi:hypothetical protein